MIEFYGEQSGNNFDKKVDILFQKGVGLIFVLILMLKKW